MVPTEPHDNPQPRIAQHLGNDAKEEREERKMGQGLRRSAGEREGETTREEKAGGGGTEERKEGGTEGGGKNSYKNSIFGVV